jgi:hypothetical protein
MTTLKTIQYRGGIARFQVPATWVEEYEPRGGGTFYEPGDDTGTLRINVLGFEKPDDGRLASTDAFELLTATRPASETERLPNGTAISRYVAKGLENGEHLLLYRWEILVCVSATHYRIVVFTYTIVAGQERAPQMQDELKLLDRSITSGEYPPLEGIAGDFVHEPAT